MISQSMNAVPPGLQALMVLRQESSPTAPGPNGPIPSMAAQELQKVAQAQNPGLSGIAQNTATGNAIEMQQQQAAQKALMDQMLAQQQAKTQQPVMAAEGGIASLYAGNMDDFAEGGVVGYNGTEDSFVDRLPEDSLLKRFINWYSSKQALQEPIPEETPQPMVPATLGAQAPTGGGLTTEAARGQAPREERKPPPAPEQKPAATGIASGRGSNIPSIQQLIQQATASLDPAIAELKAPKVLTPQQIEELDLAELRRKGLPEQEKAAEEQGLAELRRQNEAIREFQRQMLAKKEAALGTPGEQSMNRFMAAVRYGAQGGKGSFAQGLENAILAERQSAEARDVERLKRLEADKAEAIEYTRIQALIDEARRLKALGRVDEAQKLEEAARQAANDRVKARIEGIKSAIGPAISAFSGMRQQEIQAAEAARARTAGQQLTPAVRILYENKLAAAAQAGQNVNDPVFKNTALTEAIREAATSQSGVGGRQNIAALKELIDSLQSATDPTKNFDGASREQAAKLLRVAQGRLAEMSGISAESVPSGVPAPKTQAEFDALPKGSRYINPADGKEYIKN